MLPRRAFLSSVPAAALTIRTGGSGLRPVMPVSGAIESGAIESGAMASGGFRVAGGKIVDPSGRPWAGHGINVDDWAAVGGGGPGNPGNGTWPVDASGNQVPGADGLYIFALFPHCNIVRLACSERRTGHDSRYPDDPLKFAAFIGNLTARKCVVVIEDHAGPSPSIPQGRNTAQQRWYAAMAAAFRHNPYVWYGTLNEPWGHATADAICQNQLDTYQTLRDAGVTSPILLEISNPPFGWGAAWLPPQAHYFKGMHNVVWDVHIYGGAGRRTASQAANNAAVAAAVARVVHNGISSADGKIPIIVGEYGPSTSGTEVDPNGTQNVIAVQTAQIDGLVAATIAWSWYDGKPDNVQDRGHRTNFGNELNNYFNGTVASAWTE